MGLTLEVMRGSKIVAVVGISTNPSKPSYQVAHYLKSQGYTIIPVNPNLHEVLGEQCYPNLLAIPQKVDIVDIFRRSEDVSPVVEEAISIKAKAVWMQLGIYNQEAADRARANGVNVVMDMCMSVEHRRLVNSGHLH